MRRRREASARQDGYVQGRWDGRVDDAGRCRLQESLPLESCLRRQHGARLAVPAIIKPLQPPRPDSQSTAAWTGGLDGKAHPPAARAPKWGLVQTSGHRTGVRVAVIWLGGG